METALGFGREQWGKLADNDLEKFTGQKDHLAEQIQGRYGIATAEVEKQVDDLIEKYEGDLMLTNVLRWSAIPAVLIASPLSGLAGAYEPLLNALVCMAAIVLLQRATMFRQYVSGAGFIAIAVVFGPFDLAVKILLLLSLACIAAFSGVLAGFRVRPSTAARLAP